jgi:hypothetical protein
MGNDELPAGPPVVIDPVLPEALCPAVDVPVPAKPVEDTPAAPTAWLEAGVLSVPHADNNNNPISAQLPGVCIDVVVAGHDAGECVVLISNFLLLVRVASRVANRLKCQLSSRQRHDTTWLLRAGDDPSSSSSAT